MRHLWSRTGACVCLLVPQGGQTTIARGEQGACMLDFSVLLHPVHLLHQGCAPLAAPSSGPACVPRPFAVWQHTACRGSNANSPCYCCLLQDNLPISPKSLSKPSPSFPGFVRTTPRDPFWVFPPITTHLSEDGRKQIPECRGWTPAGTGSLYSVVGSKLADDSRVQ